MRHTEQAARSDTMTIATVLEAGQLGSAHMNTREVFRPKSQVVGKRPASKEVFCAAPRVAEQNL